MTKNRLRDVVARLEEAANSIESLAFDLFQDGKATPGDLDGFENEAEGLRELAREIEEENQ